MYYESAHKYIQMGVHVVILRPIIYRNVFHDIIELIEQSKVLLPSVYDKHQSRMYWPIIIV
ncbi:hypothetical protein DE146DRAFT_662264 [Phaeosphaeria sp. MPI-PUGE-AT-0046c]|nr:hypothetical protein DE146DRAFT_662264 [Phaeosphaeria sp. MPI-PUGE-AT-0046c]